MCLVLSGCGGENQGRLPDNQSTLSASVSAAYAAIGDSVTACTGVIPSRDCWPNILAAFKGWTLTNFAVKGTAANDPEQIGIIVRATPAMFVNYTWLCCVNDMRNNLNASQQLVWAQTVEAGLWWLATPEANKIRANSGGVTYTGTWTPPQTSYGLLRETTDSGATAMASVYGTDIVVIGGWQSGNSSVWSVTLDGKTYPTFTTSTGAYSSIAEATDFGPSFIHFTGLKEITHSVQLNCVTASVGNPCYLWAFGTSMGGTAENAPTVYAGSTARLMPEGYKVTSSPGCPTAPCGGDTHVLQLNELEQKAVADLAQSGLNVLYVDINAPGFYVPDTTNTQGDGVHPSAAGDARIANAFMVKASSTPVHTIPISVPLLPSFVERPFTP
jgi:hypothetical protein